MLQWFLSLRGALALSILALISEVWRSYLDAMFVLPVDFGTEALMNLGAVIFTVLFGLWVWSLILTSRGSRGGLYAAFFINALVLFGIPVSWLLVYCPAACQAEAGIFNLANTLNLVLGVLAALSLGVQVWRAFSGDRMKPVRSQS
jgi:hypothetical protein